MDQPPVYLDYSATTPVDERVLQAMIPWLSERYGNPASRSHAYGWDAEDAVEHARAQVAGLVGAEPREIIWTSGATESDNLAIKGTAGALSARGRHIVTVRTEHKAVLDACHQLEREGFELSWLDTNEDGLLDPAVFEAALRPDTILASVMLVNNEIGVVQDIATLAAISHRHGVVFHSDAAQATGKVAIDVAAMDVDLMSFSAHKTYGPKGIGALYVRRKPRARIEAQMHGGGHERGMRSGTLPTHQIVGMGEAFELAGRLMADEEPRIRGLRDRLLAGLQLIPDLYVNGSMAQRVAHNLNVSVAHIEGEALLMALPELAVSSGSACTSASLEPSYVLRALGRSDELAHSSLRLTLGRQTTEADIELALRVLTREIARLRELSPLWEMREQGIDVSSVQWAIL